MYRFRRTEYLARPGTPLRYSLESAARLLGISHITLRQAISDGRIASRRASGHGRTRHWIARSELARYARLLYADRPVRLARILAAPFGVVALSTDRALRRTLAPYKPRFASSPYGLAQILMVHVANTVVVDWETAGSEAARDIAERIGSCPDRPYLIGILPEFIEGKPKYWDCVFRRPYKAQDVQSAIKSHKR